ncbi:hypothetical protein DTO96_101489 [Ephemeroptericola cinctiostellae]|uniref:Uncharacterized protein n=1 Tax=Ephemeroptericola cinctiostellae TaxID=2268024 RepID=A0A345DBL5_9BURK|nr:hypothetical protein DTO96_101489 [Ephemeroptericola cinctiostellae]
MPINHEPDLAYSEPPYTVTIWQYSSLCGGSNNLLRNE